jgi:isoamylase
MPKPYQVLPGFHYPLGSLRTPHGTNFSVFSRHAKGMELLLYEAADSPDPFQVIELRPSVNHTYDFWHVLVEGLVDDVHYTWRAHGRSGAPVPGMRFDPRKELVDPWARAVTGAVWNRALAVDPERGGRSSFRAISLPRDQTRLAGQRVRRTLANAVIYELHVGGYTRHPSSGVARPGKFAGLVEKIPYLRELGITHVELLPVMAFDEQDVPPGTAALGLSNYWGYSTHSYFSPHPGYCVTPERGTHQQEFRELVAAMHGAGIGVILDVVFNHTAEAGADGPLINFRGLFNDIFYMLGPDAPEHYLDYTGCGHTVNCNHPLVTEVIVRCLEYWAAEMQVDGFRFDLASVFTRGEDGTPLANPPLPWRLEFSTVLADRHLLAEAWDAGGLYQVGSYPGFRWAEWNGRYRDTIRRFVRGEPGIIGPVATCIAGSSDLYQSIGRTPSHCINFITCHDGFTLWDLVSHNAKHNEANGENNRDGCDDNQSWNCGAEGETTDAGVMRVRLRQVRNLTAILMLSRGVPMIQAGDEVLRSQRGNNNAWCQDNELSWFDWRFCRDQDDMLRFTRSMIAFRKRHPCLTTDRFFTGEVIPQRGIRDIAWHGVRLNQPAWRHRDARFLSFTIAAVDSGEEDIHAMLNMSDSRVMAQLPVIRGRTWHRAVDTGIAPPDEIRSPGEQKPHEDGWYEVGPRSVVVLEARS